MQGYYSYKTIGWNILIKDFFMHCAAAHVSTSYKYNIDDRLEEIFYIADFNIMGRKEIVSNPLPSGRVYPILS